MSSNIPWWSSETFWKKTAIWVTGFMFLVLIALTVDTLPQISVGSERVPAYSVINKHISSLLSRRLSNVAPEFVDI